MQQGVQTDATCNTCKTMLGVLANNVASVCTGLKRAGKRPAIQVELFHPELEYPIHYRIYIILMASVKKWLSKSSKLVSYRKGPHSAVQARRISLENKGNNFG